jgi:uncharacterized protein (TIGR02466 family)
MEIANLFPTPLIIIDASTILSEVQDVFNSSTLKLNRDKLQTSLNMWCGGKAKVNFTKNNAAGIVAKFVLENAKEYLEKAGFNLEEIELEVPNIWCNAMTSGSMQKDHNHVGCVMSGCFYLEVPDDCGPIKFYNPFIRFDRVFLPIKTHTEYTSEGWAVKPKVGQLFMWPSHLFHGVPASEFEGVRRSVAFDVVVKEFYE